MSQKRRANPVAKNLNVFNIPATHTDRKKASKKGYRKHSGKSFTQGDYKAAA